jgi:hypothetical protein
MLKKTQPQDIIIAAGVVLVAVFNPLSLMLWVDALILALDKMVEVLVQISDHTMVVGFTLIITGLLFRKMSGNKKEAKRLKSLKTKKTKTPEYI